jgi:hypothetical protein
MADKKNIDEAIKKLEEKLRDSAKKAVGKEKPKEPIKKEENKEEKEEIAENFQRPDSPNNLNFTRNVENFIPGGIDTNSISGQNPIPRSLERNLENVNTVNVNPEEKKDEKLYQEARNSYETQNQINRNSTFAPIQRESFNEIRPGLNQPIDQRRIGMVREGMASGNSESEIYEVRNNLESNKPQDLFDPNASVKMKKYQPR